VARRTRVRRREEKCNSLMCVGETRRRTGGRKAVWYVRRAARTPGGFGAGRKTFSPSVPTRHGPGVFHKSSESSAFPTRAREKKRIELCPCTCAPPRLSRSPVTGRAGERARADMNYYRFSAAAAQVTEGQWRNEISSWPATPRNRIDNARACSARAARSASNSGRRL